MSKETEMVKSCYGGMVDVEWERLVQDDFHRLEYDTTWHFLNRYLPKTSLILDAGGGPGRYTIDLAKRGYDVILLDLTPENLSRAREEIRKAGVESRVKGIIEGTITDLSQFGDNVFDAVVCTGGPLSHVHPAEERQKAVSELVRVAKNGSPIFVSIIGKYGVFLSTPSGWPQNVTYKEYFQKMFETGDDYHWVRTGFCHYFTAGELGKLFKREDVSIVHLIGLEGLNHDVKLTNEFAARYPEAYRNWLEIHLQICTDPFVVDASDHMMVVARKQ
jgi:ubiquinone/menaquinone biosynthesis C-methylase UbiE